MQTLEAQIWRAQFSITHAWMAASYKALSCDVLVSAKPKVALMEQNTMTKQNGPRGSTLLSMVRYGVLVSPPRVQLPDKGCDGNECDSISS